MTDLDIEIRAPRTERELNFVRHAWTASYAHFRPARTWWSNGHAAKIVQMPLGLYYREHRQYVDEMLAAGAVEIAATRGDVVAGFASVADGRIHYVYTAFPFRRFGVARSLLQKWSANPMVLVTWTPVIEHIQLPAGWIYNEVAKWRQ